MGLYAAIFFPSLSLSYFSIIIIIIDAQRTFIEYTHMYICMMILFDYSALFVIILSFIEL